MFVTNSIMNSYEFNYGGIGMSNSIFKLASNDLRDALANCQPSQLLYAPLTLLNITIPL